MDPITLPGDIPGLLRRGAPVVVDRFDGYDTVGRVHAPGAGGNTSTADQACVIRTDANGWARADHLPLGRLCLDLRDEAGVDRALRWLGEAVPLRPQRQARPQDPFRPEADPAAVLRGIGLLWVRKGHRSWHLLTAGVAEHVAFAPPGVDAWQDEHRVDVPALASIPLDHPDADLLALAACVLHVAGRA
jgi:hypothetical protein